MKKVFLFSLLFFVPFSIFLGNSISMSKNIEHSSTEDIETRDSGDEKILDLKIESVSYTQMYFSFTWTSDGNYKYKEVWVSDKNTTIDSVTEVSSDKTEYYFEAHIWGLSPSTTYSYLNLNVLSAQSLGHNSTVSTAPIPTFTTLDNQYEKPSVTSIDLDYIDQTSADFNYVVNPGSSIDGTPYIVTSVTLKDLDTNESTTIKTTSKTGNIIVEDLDPGETYDNFVFYARTTGGETDKKSIESFTTDFFIIAPSFNNVTVNIQQDTVDIDYKIDLGNDEKGNQYKLTSDVELYDGDNELIMSDDSYVIDNNSVSGSMELNDINDPENTTLDWYLKVDTNYNKESVEYDLSNSNYIIINGEKNLIIVWIIIAAMFMILILLLVIYYYSKRRRKTQNLKYFQKILEKK